MKKILSVLIIVVANLGCRTDRNASLDLEVAPAEAELFGKGIVSTNLYERDMAISPRGGEVVFTLSDYGQTKRCLVMITKTGSKWGNKQILSFSGRYSDIEPFFSADGNQLFFASNRPINGDINRSDYNIWVVERNDSGWGEPQSLSSNINSKRDEFYPSVSSNGNLYFTAQRENGIGGEDIFMSKLAAGHYLDPVPLDSAINSPGDEFNAYIHPEENLVVFGSYGRADGLGGVDLYYSRKNTAGQWMPAVNMGPAVNSTGLDFCPFIDVSRGNFYFTSDRTKVPEKRIGNIEELEALSNGVLNGMGNIYRINIERLGLK